MIIKKDKRHIISEFLDCYYCLDPHTLKTYFRELVLKAFYSVQANGFIQLQCGHVTISDMFDFSKRNIHDLSPIVVVWRGVEYKRLVVYIDINPVIRFNGWPPKAITYSTLLTDLHKHQMYVFPNAPTPFSRPSSNLNHENDFSNWSYSFVLVENQIFQELTEVLKDAFTLCKALRKEPLLPYLRRYGDVSHSVSKVDINVTYTDATAPSKFKISLGNTDGSIKDKEASDTFEMKHNFEKEICDNVDVSIDNDSSVSTISENSSTTTSLGSSSSDDDNIEGEKIISSYYLKQIFLYEVENIPSDKRHDNNLTELIAYKVYRRLLSCYEAGMTIPSFFFREQNICEQIRPSLAMRLCSNIVTMLEKLGFNYN